MATLERDTGSHQAFIDTSTYPTESHERKGSAEYSIDVQLSGIDMILCHPPIGRHFCWGARCNNNP